MIPTVIFRRCQPNGSLPVSALNMLSKLLCISLFQPLLLTALARIALGWGSGLLTMRPTKGNSANCHWRLLCPAARILQGRRIAAVFSTDDVVSPVVARPDVGKI